MRFSTYCWLAVENSRDYDRTPRIRDWLWARDVNTEQENYASNVQLARMSPHKWIQLAAHTVTYGEDDAIRQSLERETIEELMRSVHAVDEGLGDLPDIAAYSHSGTYWEVSLPDYVEQRQFYGQMMHEIHGCTLAVIYKEDGRFRVVDPRDFQTLLDSREAVRTAVAFETFDESHGTLSASLDRLLSQLHDSLGVPAEAYRDTAPSFSGRHTNATPAVQAVPRQQPVNYPAQSTAADVVASYAKRDMEATMRLLQRMLARPRSRSGIVRAVDSISSTKENV